MFSRIRKRLTYTNVAMTLALVFAMSGGAYAAGKYLITSTKQISPKVLKSLKGKNGANGAVGAQGPAGPAGAVGASGPAGPAGAAGPKGETGSEGKVGKEGKTGFTKTLPSGETLKGDWSEIYYAQGGALEGFGASPVSFGIPFAQAPISIHRIAAPTAEEEAKGEFPTPPKGCTGNVTEPGAEKGNLCVFASEEHNVEHQKICPVAPFHCAFQGGGTPEEADPYGFNILVEAKEKGLAIYAGTWAVTAE